ncbi:MAG: Rieske 2Fe-2S domain-containing protein [Acidimicrobiia bacterium]
MRVGDDLLAAVEDWDAIDAPAAAVAARVRALPIAVRDVLHGVRLGAPLHPVLTDVTIGLWTTAFLLDPVGSRERRAARVFVGLGVLSAVPTAASGLADWSQLDDRERRVGAVHAALMLTATAAYARSFRRRRRGRGIVSALAGAAIATAGAHLGGLLVYRRGAGVRRPLDPGQAATPVRLTGSAGPDGSLTVVDVDADRRAVVGWVAGRPCAVDERCTHLGGPLGDGERTAEGVRCPWHGSEFRLTDGSVVHGPATAPLRTYPVEPFVPAGLREDLEPERR